MKLRVLDLFAGEKGWSQAFADAGHIVVTVELNPAQNPTICADITKLDADTIRQAFGGHDPDIILASPPCTAFSVASIGHHWQGGFRAYIPKTDAAKFSLLMVQKTLDLITELKPKWWWLENPRGVLRKLPIMAPFERTTIHFCKYGETRMKPTDLWGVWPTEWTPRVPCRYRVSKRIETDEHGVDWRIDENGDRCHHAAPRSTTKQGTQSIKGANIRAIIPYELSDEVRIACEKATKKTNSI